MFRYTKLTLLREIGLWALALLFLAPFYFLVTTALKPANELFTTSALAPPVHPDFSNKCSLAAVQQHVKDHHNIIRRKVLIQARMTMTIQTAKTFQRATNILTILEGNFRKVWSQKNIAITVIERKLDQKNGNLNRTKIAGILSAQNSIQEMVENLMTHMKNRNLCNWTRINQFEVLTKFFGQYIQILMKTIGRSMTNKILGHHNQMTARKHRNYTMQ